LRKETEISVSRHVTEINVQLMDLMWARSMEVGLRA